MLRQMKFWVMVSLVLLCAVPAWAERGIGHTDAYCSGFYTTKHVDAMYVVAGEDKDDSLSYSTPMYVYLSQGGLTPGSEYMIIRRAKDPTKTRAYRGQGADARPMGILFADVARVKVVVSHQNVSTAQVIFSCEEILPGDRVIAAETRPMPEYQTHKFDHFAPPSGKVVGSIVNAKDFEQFLGQGRYIHVNLGSSQVKVGDYLRAFRYGGGARYEATGFGGVYGMSRGPIKKNTLPREVLGEVMVIRTDEKAAVAIVTYSQREIIVGDYVELE